MGLEGEGALMVLCGGFKVQYTNLITQPGTPGRAITPTGDPNGASSASHSGHFMAGERRALWLDREPVYLSPSEPIVKAFVA